MDRNADIGVPRSKFLTQRCATGNEFRSFASHSRTDFAEHESIRNLPRQRPRPFFRHHFFTVSSSDSECPAIDDVLGEGDSLQENLLANLFVHAGYPDKDVRLYFVKNGR